MNFWLLTGEYPPDYGGGIATYSLHTAQMLSERGHFVTVFAAKENQPTSWEVEVINPRLRVVRFASNQLPHSQILGADARWSLDAAHVLTEFCRREAPPDVLETQEYLGLPYFLLQRRWTLDPDLPAFPVLVTAHTPLYVCHRYDKTPRFKFPGYWAGEMERFSLLAADGVVFPSHHLRNEIGSELPQVSANSRVIANPYRMAYEPSPASGANRKGFLFIAKIERRKGIEPLLNAFRRLWDKGIQEPLILLGGDWYDELRQVWMSQVIRDRYAEYIEQGLLDWRGKQPPGVVQSILTEVRASILPSLFENYPYAVLETMNAGVPAIVSQSGGHAEIIEDGKSGWVFDLQQAGALEEKIRAALDLSPEQWEQFSRSAQARTKQLNSYAVVAPQKEEALEWVRNRFQQPRRWFPFLRGEPRAYQPPTDPSENGIEGLLSVVIPFHNLGKYIEDSVRSVLQAEQDVPLEILVIDDGSDDLHSVSVLEELEQRYPIRVERSANQGVSLARNTGARLARGEFLAFLDADDCVDKHFYPRALAILRQFANVHFVGCWMEFTYETHDFWPTWNTELPYSLVYNPLSSSALVYRRADFLRYGLNDPQFAYSLEDYDSVLSMLENQCYGVAIPEPYLKYRVRRMSMYHSTSLNSKIVAYQWLAEKHASLYKDYTVDVASLLIANGPGYLCDNPTRWYPALGWESVSSTVSQLSGEMPPAPASTYLYFAIRAALLRPYHTLRCRFKWLEQLQRRVKRRLVK